MGKLCAKSCDRCDGDDRCDVGFVWFQRFGDCQGGRHGGDYATMVGRFALDGIVTLVVMIRQRKPRLRAAFTGRAPSFPLITITFLPPGREELWKQGLRDELLFHMFALWDFNLLDQSNVRVNVARVLVCARERLLNGAWRAGELLHLEKEGGGWFREKERERENERARARDREVLIDWAASGR